MPPTGQARDRSRPIVKDGLFAADAGGRAAQGAHKRRLADRAVAAGVTAADGLRPDDLYASSKRALLKLAGALGITPPGAAPSAYAKAALVAVLDHCSLDG